MEQPSSNPSTSNRQLITRRLPAALLLAGGLLASGSCGLIRAPAPRLTAPMPVQAPLRKQVLQGYMPFGSIGWVDNEQVVFHGIPIGSKGKQALYLWDLKGKPRLLLTNSLGSCVSEQTIRAVQLRDSGKSQTFSFIAPDFKSLPLSTTQQMGPGVLDPVSCSWINSPKTLRGHKWQALRKGEGFLDFTPNGRQSGPIWYVEHLDANEQIRQDTGIRMPKPMLPMAVHAAYDDSYLVFDLHLNQAEAERWITSNNRTIWRLHHPRGSQAMRLPAGPWVGLGGGTINFLPARPGVLITSNNFARDGATGGAGLYLLPPGSTPNRLEKGLVQEATISPDGCRIAYSFKPRLGTGIPEGGPRLVAIDLCTLWPSKSRNAESR